MSKDSQLSYKLTEEWTHVTSKIDMEICILKSALQKLIEEYIIMKVYEENIGTEKQKNPSWYHSLCPRSDVKVDIYSMNTWIYTIVSQICNLHLSILIKRSNTAGPFSKWLPTLYDTTTNGWHEYTGKIQLSPLVFRNRTLKVYKYKKNVHEVTIGGQNPIDYDAYAVSSLIHDSLKWKLWVDMPFHVIFYVWA